MVLFGSDNQMKVHIVPASDESTTVEQHLRSECEMLMQRVRVSPVSTNAHLKHSRSQPPRDTDTATRCKRTADTLLLQQPNSV